MNTPGKPTDAGDDASAETAGREPSPARLEDVNGEHHPAPKAGSEEALNEERKTRPSRNRGVTDV